MVRKWGLVGSPGRRASVQKEEEPQGPLTGDDAPSPAFLRGVAGLDSRLVVGVFSAEFDRLSREVSVALGERPGVRASTVVWAFLVENMMWLDGPNVIGICEESEVVDNLRQEIRSLTRPRRKVRRAGGIGGRQRTS